MSWSDGCLADLDYICSYEYSPSPLNIELCLLFASKAFLPAKKSYRYLELGCGHGLSLNIHAAVSDGEFWGVEANADAAFFANELANSSENNVKICNQSFAEFAQRDDLPEFDIIVMHEIWSFISCDDQKAIIDFVGHKLSAGGIFYVSYNTPLGKFARSTPLYNLMKLHYDRATRQFDQATIKVKDTVNFVINATTPPHFLKKNPQVIDDIGFIKNSNPSYILRQYLGSHLTLTPFSKMAESLSEAKLHFAAHGKLIENIDSLFLTEESENFLKNITDSILKEATRDLLSNHETRFDIWLKGSRQLSMIERTKALSDLRFILSTTADSLNIREEVFRGEGAQKSEIYTLVLDCMAENNYLPKSADDLVNYHQLRSFDKVQILDALIALTAFNYVYLVQENEVVESATSKTKALNTYLLEQAVYNDHIGYLASPVAGRGIEVNRIHRLFMLARIEGVSSPEQWASLAWQLISQQEQGQAIEIEGKKIISPSDGIAVLTTMAQNFAEKKLPLFKMLGIAE